MMNVHRATIIIFIAMIGCTSSNVINQGRVVPPKFYTKSTFTTAKSLIILACNINGETKNFLFDTGATVTSIHRDSLIGKIVEVHGASNRTIENGSEIIKSLSINGVDFIKTFASNENFTFLNEKIPNFGGILGRSVINKANWLIDYPNNTIELSDGDLSDETFVDIPLNMSSHAPITIVEINNKKYDAIIDLGSTSTFNVPRSTALAQHLLDQYTFHEKQRERYTVGGLELVNEFVGVVPELKIGALTFIM